MPRETITLEYCDYCHKDGKKTEATETIKINGKEALACDAHAKPVLKVLEAFEAVAVALPVTQSAPARSSRPRGSRGSRGAAKVSPDGAPSASEVRAWAQANDIAVSAKARVANDVWEKFYETFPDRRPAS